MMKYCQPGAPVVSLCPVEDHVEEVEAGWEPDDDEDHKTAVELVLSPD